MQGDIKRQVNNCEELSQMKVFGWINGQEKVLAGINVNSLNKTQISLSNQ